MDQSLTQHCLDRAIPVRCIVTACEWNRLKTGNLYLRIPRNSRGEGPSGRRAACVKRRERCSAQPLADPFLGLWRRLLPASGSAQLTVRRFGGRTHGALRLGLGWALSWRSRCRLHRGAGFLWGRLLLSWKHRQATQDRGQGDERCTESALRQYFLLRGGPHFS